MKKLIEVTKMLAEKYSNIDTEIEQNTIRLKFYKENKLYKQLEVTECDNQLKVLILPSNIPQFTDLKGLEDIIEMITKQVNFVDHSREKIEQIKQKYNVGTKVEVIKMYDLQVPPTGTKGVIVAIDDIGNIHVDWENGSTLSLVEGMDKFKILEND